MTDVSRGHFGRKLDLDAHDLAVNAFDDEIDLAVTSDEAKVTHACFRGLGHNPHTKCHKRFEERSGHVRPGRPEQ